MTATYFYWALQQYKHDIKSIEDVTRERKVFRISALTPKWKAADFGCQLSGPSGSPAFSEFSKLVHFLDNAFYNTRLTARKVELALRILNSLIQTKAAVLEEVRTYRSMQDREILRELKSRMLGKSKMTSRWTVKDLVCIDFKTEQLGPLAFQPGELNSLCLGSFYRNSNDGTVAKKIGADIFNRISGYSFERDSARAKIVGRNARVLMCGDDVIVTEPLGKSISVPRNDPHWEGGLRESIQPLLADYNTPRNRLAAEIILASVSGEKSLIRFVQERLSKTK